MKHLLFCCLCSVVKAQEIFELNKKVIDVFLDKINFLCVVHYNDLNNIGIIGGLSARNVKTYNNIDVANGGRRTECGHSVIIARDESFLDFVLVKQHENFLFQVHSTILVFFRGVDKINMKKFQNLAIEKDIEVIVVQGLGLKSLFPPRERKVQLRVYSAMKNQLLMNCSSPSLSCFANFTYVRTKWTPVFMLTKLKKEFRIGFSIYPPFVIREGDRLTGIDIEVAKLLTEGWPVYYKNLGKDVDRQRSDLHRYPVYYLKTSEADITIGGSKFIGEKSHTYPYSSQCNTFLVHRGQLYPEATFTFQFFQAPLWVVFICSLLFMAVFLKFSSGIYTKKYSLSYCLVLIIGYVSSYGVPPFPPPRQTFMRFISLWWCFISLIIATYFSAGLTTSLRIPRLHSVISTWEEMVQSRIKWLDLNYEGVSEMQESGGTLKSLVKLFQLEKSEQAISKKLRLKKYALRVEKFQKNILNVMSELDDYGRKNMKILDNCYALHHLQYEITYNSAVADFFNIKLLHIVEAGFVDNAFEELADDPKRAYMEYLSTHKPPVNLLFTLRKLVGCFLLLSTGILLGALSLFYEFYIYQSGERKEKKILRGIRPKKRKVKKKTISV